MMFTQADLLLMQWWLWAEREGMRALMNEELLALCHDQGVIAFSPCGQFVAVAEAPPATRRKIEREALNSMLDSIPRQS